MCIDSIIDVGVHVCIEIEICDVHTGPILAFFCFKEVSIPI